MGLLARLRTYAGLTGMQRKLVHLLDEFDFARMMDIYTPYEERPAASRTSESEASSSHR